MLFLMIWVPTKKWISPSNDISNNVVISILVLVIRAKMLLALFFNPT